MFSSCASHFKHTSYKNDHICLSRQHCADFLRLTVPAAIFLVNMTAALMNWIIATCLNIYMSFIPKTQTASQESLHRLCKRSVWCVTSPGAYMPQTESFQSSSAVREISCNPHCIGWNSHLCLWKMHLRHT